MIHWGLLWSLIAVPAWAWAELPVGQKPPRLELSGERGERVLGGAWSSDELSGAVHVMFYVDPDESDLNNAASDALKAAQFDEQKFRSVAIINMDATWLPNGVVQMKLKSKQEEFPRTVYVRDFQKVLVNEWGLADDTSDVVVFDTDGTVLFSVDGQLSDAQIQQMLSVIRERM